MSVAITVPKEVYVVPPTVSPETIRTLRARLKAAIEQIWATPEGQSLALALSQAAQDYGAALRSLYETTGFKNQIRSLAEQYDIAGRFRRLWGKP